MEKKNKLKLWLGLIGISLILWLGDGKGYFNWLKRPVSRLSQPVRHQLYNLKSRQRPETDSEAVAQTAVLEAEILKLKQENEKLRELLGTKLPADWQFVPAKILELKDKIMVIDAGKSLGVREGQAVIGINRAAINNGVVIGRVRQIFEYQAEVELLGQTGVEVKVRTASGVLGTVKSAAGKIRLTEVLQKDRLMSDELIMTAGQDGWPVGLVIGRVGEITKDDAAVFKEAEVKTLIEAKELSQVFVVKF